MLTLLSAFVGSALLFCTYHITKWYLRQSRYRLPPGPFNLPFLGSILTSDLNSFQRGHYNNAKKYGPVVRTVMGPFEVIQLNDPGVIKEAFSRDVLVPRPHFWLTEQRNIVNHGATGVVFSEGEMWKEHRRFILQTFRDFGVGKFMMEEKIIEEAGYLITLLEATNGQPINTRPLVSSTVANVIGSVLMGTRYAADDEEFLKIIRYTTESIEFTFDKVFLLVFPAFRHFPPMRAVNKEFMHRLRGFYEFFKKPCDKHLKEWQPDSNANFLEAYISAVKEGRHKTLDIKEMPLLLEDLFEAGFETTTTTLRWAFLIMAGHPNIQRQVQEELDKNLPTGSFAKYSDKERLPYVEATIMEVHRFASVAPMGVNHCAQEDITIENYDIPKGTWVQANIYYVHHNDEWWDKPEEFNPGRFLTSDNQIQASEYLIPFGLGKRRCLGEALARAELFTLFSAVMHRFTITLPDHVQTADLRPRPRPGIIADTQPHQLRFHPRKT